MISCGGMKHAPSRSTSRNSDPVYKATLPSSPPRLPPIERRTIAGIETAPDVCRTNSGLFGQEVRHYNLIARAVSSPAVTLEPYNRGELEGSVTLACGFGSVDQREGIPSLARGSIFRVTRSADLFFGGTIHELTPGVYVAGDTIVDKATGRVYLEFEKGGKTAVGVIGLFMTGRLPSCVDWRVMEAVS